MNIDTPYKYNKTNELCELMAKYGSDKGALSHNGWHNYTTYYFELFNPVRHEPLRVFELGLGTNNLDVDSNMGASGKPGASLRGWRDFFPNANVYGADIDTRILFEETRIKTYYCDQTVPESIQDLWNQPELQEEFDIIIEDGLHAFHANKCFFENSIHKLKVGGVFIIEDIIVSNLPVFITAVGEWIEKYKDYEIKIQAITNPKNNYDNVLIVAKRLA